jgi:hypothetical protein
MPHPPSASPSAQPHDDLLTPSLGEREAPSTRRPWRVGSQVWIALFGGPLPVALIAWCNAGRLGMQRRRRGWILGCGALGFLLALAAAWWIGLEHPGLRGARSLLRLAVRAAGLLTYAAVAWLQRPADRAFRIFDERGYASLWLAGVAATFGLGLVQAVAVWLVARAASP